MDHSWKSRYYRHAITMFTVFSVGTAGFIHVPFALAQENDHGETSLHVTTESTQDSTPSSEDLTTSVQVTATSTSSPSTSSPAFPVEEPSTVGRISDPSRSIVIVRDESNTAVEEVRVYTNITIVVLPLDSEGQPANEGSLLRAHVAGVPDGDILLQRQNNGTYTGKATPRYPTGGRNRPFVVIRTLTDDVVGGANLRILPNEPSEDHTEIHASYAVPAADNSPNPAAHSKINLTGTVHDDRGKPVTLHDMTMKVTTNNNETKILRVKSDREGILRERSQGLKITINSGENGDHTVVELFDGDNTEGAPLATTFIVTGDGSTPTRPTTSRASSTTSVTPTSQPVTSVPQPEPQPVKPTSQPDKPKPQPAPTPTPAQPTVTPVPAPTTSTVSAPIPVQPAPAAPVINTGGGGGGGGGGFILIPAILLALAGVVPVVAALVGSRLPVGSFHIGNLIGGINSVISSLLRR